MKETIKDSHIKINIVEKSGPSLKQQLKKSDPFKNKLRKDHENCMTCKSNNKHCRKEGITYSLTCDKCS